MEYARWFGPCLRTIKELLRDLNPRSELNDLEKVIDLAATDVAEDVGKTLRCIKDLDFSSSARTPLALFFITPGQMRTSRPLLVVPTPYLASKLGRAIIGTANAFTVQSFSALCAHPSSRATAGWIYENYMHAYLTTPDAEITVVDDRGYRIEVKGASIVEGTLDALKTSIPPFYWRPSTSDFVGADAVIRVNSDIWAFQVTIGSRHGPTNKGLAALVNTLGAKSKETLRWHLVIIGPKLDDVQNVCEGQKVPSYISKHMCQLEVIKGYEGATYDLMASVR
jgi:hypothetical protein